MLGRPEHPTLQVVANCFIEALCHIVKIGGTSTGVGM